MTIEKKPDSSGKEESPMAHAFHAVGDENANAPTIEYDRYMIS